MRRQRGSALVLVMWLTMLRAAVVCTFALAAQMERLQGRTLSRGVVAEQAARAGVEYALTRLTETDPTPPWLPDARRDACAAGDPSVLLAVVDVSGTGHPHAADVHLLPPPFPRIRADPHPAGATLAAPRDRAAATRT